MLVQIVYVVNIICGVLKMSNLYLNSIYYLKLTVKRKRTQTRKVIEISDERLLMKLNFS